MDWQDICMNVAIAILAVLGLIVIGVEGAVEIHNVYYVCGEIECPGH
jgi:hypothetical protein